MASSQAKIGWKMMTQRENKDYRFISFRHYPTRNRKFQKNSKKIKKIEKYHNGFFSTRNTLEEAMKEGK